jgi:RND superfamily putative drug exporter
VVAVAAGIGGASIFDTVKPYGFQDPGSESARATELLEDATGERPTPDAVLLVESSGPAARRAATARAKDKLSTVPSVARVVTPANDPQLISRDGDAALVVGYLDADTEDIAEVGEAVEDRVGGLDGVTAGGAAVTAYQLNETSEDDLRRIELFAAPILFLLSLLVFRGLVAAMLPLAVGLVSIVTTIALLQLLTSVMEVDVFVVSVVIGLGLGLAIDYSLFVVSRFREELDRDATGVAIRSTIGSTGRMILFSGVTVAIALASLTVFPQRFLYSVGVGGAIVALISAVVSVTVLPALLALLGDRVNALAPRRLQAPPSGARWHRLGRFVLRHPGAITLIVLATMLVASIPVARVELTRADASILPSSQSAQRVDAAIDESFAGDPGSVITVVLAERGERRQVVDASAELAGADGVEVVRAPVGVGDGIRRIDAQLSVDSFSDQAVAGVGVARELDWGTPTLVDGPPAELTDQRQSLDEHLPIAIAILVLSTTLLMFAFTRSVVLPFVALLMNALTVGVAFGAVILIFQDGRLEGLLDYQSQGALDTSVPILMLAVIFGLSTDYGVFLLQRTAEARKDSGSEDEAIAQGLARSGRPITAAAALFAVAMGAFAFSDLVTLKEIAVGTAVAVIVDATLVRALLLPAILGLLGSRAWWAPRWLGGRSEQAPISAGA